jgi:hypothetical protein
LTNNSETIGHRAPHKARVANWGMWLECPFQFKDTLRTSNDRMIGVQFIGIDSEGNHYVQDVFIFLKKATQISMRMAGVPADVSAEYFPKISLQFRCDANLASADRWEKSSCSGTLVAFVWLWSRKCQIFQDCSPVALIEGGREMPEMLLCWYYTLSSVIRISMKYVRLLTFIPWWPKQILQKRPKARRDT